MLSGKGFTTGAYYQNGDFGGADTLLNAVPDQSLTTSGKDLRVPGAWSKLVAAMVATVAATRNYAQIQAPSLRTLAFQDVPIFQNNAGVLADTQVNFFPGSPRDLEADENVNFLVNTDDAAVQDHTAAIFLADGPIKPVDGKMFTVRATAAIAQAVSVWTLGVLTFQQRLPVENYDVVGMRIQAASGFLGRLVFPGQGARPGTTVYPTGNLGEINRFRYGGMGVWGTFNINQPPQLEMIGGAAVAQTVYLDLIKR